MEMELRITCGYFPYMIMNRPITNGLEKVAKECGFRLIDISPISRNGNGDEFMYQIVVASEFDSYNYIYELRSALNRFKKKASDYLKSCESV